MGPDRVKVTRSNPCGMSRFFSACMHCLRLLKNASQKKEAQKKPSCNIVSPTGAGEKRRRIKSWCCNYPAGAAVISPSPATENRTSTAYMWSAVSAWENTDLGCCVSKK